MIGRLSLVWLLACFTLAWPALARDTADLAVEAQVIPSGPIQAGSVVQIVLTVTNRGPDAAPGSGIISSDYVFLVGGLFDLYGSPPLQCPVYYDDFAPPPGEPGFLVAAVITGNLAPGASRTCTLSLFVYPESRGPYELGFRADSGAVDGNLSNNSVTLPLYFAEPPPRKIPAASSWSLAVTAILIIALGAASMWQRPADSMR